MGRPKVLMDSGDVYGLGENWYGQLGIGSKERPGGQGQGAGGAYQVQWIATYGIFINRGSPISGWFLLWKIPSYYNE